MGDGNNNGVIVNFNNCKIKTNASLTLQDNVISLNFNDCEILTSPTKGIVTPTMNSFGDITLTNCALSGSPYTLDGSDATIKDANFNIFNANNTNNFINLNYYHYAEANSSLRKNGITSFAIRPRNVNESFKKTFTIVGTQGVTQKIKGNLRFDSTYGASDPPSITFTGAVAVTTFTCPAVENTWHAFEYDFTPAYTGNIEISIIGQSSSTSGFVYVDGLLFDPFVKDIRWYGFEVDKNFYRTADSLTTLTEAQASSVNITNLDFLYDASNYWTINNPLSTSYLDLYTKNGTVLDFGDNNIVLNNSASTNFAYASASKTLTIKIPILSAGNNFNTLKTTGNVTLTNCDISFITIEGNVAQNVPSSLLDVDINGTIIYNTNSPDPTKITYTNCNVLSATNLGTANVVIKKLNSTVTYA